MENERSLALPANSGRYHPEASTPSITITAAWHRSAITNSFHEANEELLKCSCSGRENKHLIFFLYTLLSSPVSQLPLTFSANTSMSVMADYLWFSFLKIMRILALNIKYNVFMLKNCVQNRENSKSIVILTNN